MALMRFDPFREIDRIAEQVMAGSRVSRTMPMEAFRRGDEFFVYIDLPGIHEDDVELTGERNVVVASGSSGFLRARKATSSSLTNDYTASLPGSSSSVTTSTPASSALITTAACSS